jgi:1-acyl-sn-glycerol-3-phosphate acyltransferase
LITRARAHWHGCEPSPRQRIYFANHTSNLDALVLWSVLPAAVRSVTRPVAARDYWSGGWIRPWLANEVFHAVLIERKKPTAHDNPLVDMLEALGDRHSLILFPEGGRFAGPEPGPFKGGLHHLATRRPDVELVPCYIENMNRILPKGEFVPVPVLGGVTFGAPIRLEPDEAKPDFLERARRAVTVLSEV